MTYQAEPNGASEDSRFSIDVLVQKVDSAHNQSGSDLAQVRKGLQSDMTELVALTRVVRDCLRNESELLVNEFPDPAQHVQGLEKNLAGSTSETDSASDCPPQLIDFPNFLGRVGDMLRNILTCCKTVRECGMSLSAEDNAELNRLFSILLLMMQDTQVVLFKPTHQNVQSVLSDGERLGQRLLDFRIDHLHRVEATNGHYQAGSMYVYILDSIGSVKEYLEQICLTLPKAVFDAPDSECVSG
jgi:Na+/phosphate symporter